MLLEFDLRVIFGVLYSGRRRRRNAKVYIKKSEKRVRLKMI
jgi:hypothetical protein